ncbi:TIR domain-containing protein [Ideonella sp.]|uniref:toll/interleukin-1 receptor domain-containing protein n=1 Tax=Ideonella sp. TaxID=1929293 RepID=UPI0035B366FE
MPDLFISYAREDRDTALALAQALQRRGIDVWWDRELTGGGDFAAEIEHNLRAAPVAIVLWSAASVASDFVRDESGRARDMGKLVPVRISPVELPLGFGTLHTLDLLDWDGAPNAEACVALVNQVRQRLDKAGPRDTQANEAARQARLAQLASEDTLGHRRRKRRLVLGLGVAGAVGAVGLGLVGWRRFNRAEALAHLGQALADHFANPPRLESAQSEYASAIELDGGLATAHYFLAHLYAQLMLRGSPPPSGELLEALRADARLHFQRALDTPDRLDGAQRVIARGQLALLSQVDAAAAVSRPVQLDDEAEAGGTGEGAHPAPAPVRIDDTAPVPPPASVGSTAPGRTGSGAGVPDRPVEVARPPVPPVPPTAASAVPRQRVPAAAEIAQAARSRSEALFSADRDSRLAASTSLTLDPAGAAEALPSAITQARRALSSAPQAEATRQGLDATLALLERASPSSLREVRAPLQALLGELAASPLAPSTAGAASRLTSAIERSAQRRPVAYLQIARESQRPIAQALAQRLAAAGYVTPAIELTGEARAPAKPSLRVQGASDPDLARWCQKALEDAAGAPVELAFLRRAQPATDTYEIWFDKALCAPGGRSLPACA